MCSLPRPHSQWGGGHPLPILFPPRPPTLKTWLRPWLGLPFERCWDLSHQKIRVPWLSCGLVCVNLSLAVLTQYLHVTDTKTDSETHDDSVYRASIMLALWTEKKISSHCVWVTDVASCLCWQGCNKAIQQAREATVKSMRVVGGADVVRQKLQYILHVSLFIMHKHQTS